jgi:hypothetical protein
MGWTQEYGMEINQNNWLLQKEEVRSICQLSITEKGVQYCIIKLST